MGANCGHGMVQVIGMQTQQTTTKVIMGGYRRGIKKGVVRNKDGDKDRKWKNQGPRRVT